jgi:hypothetical protein
MAFREQPSGGDLPVACLHHELHNLDVRANIDIAVHLYSAVVQPAFLYECEVWGQQCIQLTDPANNSNLAVEQVQRNFLRHMLTVHGSTPVWIACTEAGMYPIQHRCLHNMLTFLRIVLQLPDREYVKIARLDCMAVANPHLQRR